MVVCPRTACAVCHSPNQAICMRVYSRHGGDMRQTLGCGRIRCARGYQMQAISPRMLGGATVKKNEEGRVKCGGGGSMMRMIPGKDCKNCQAMVVG